MGRAVKYTVPGAPLPPAVNRNYIPVEVNGSTQINTGIDLEVAYGKADFESGLYFVIPTMANGNLFKCNFPQGTILWVRQTTPDNTDIFVLTDTAKGGVY